MGTYLTGTYSVIHTIGDADFDNFVYSSIYFNVAGAFIINGIVVIGVTDKSVDIIVNENTTTLSTDFLLLGNPIVPQTKVKTGLISGDSHNEVWEFVNIKNGLSTISKNVSPKGSSFPNTYSLDFDGVDDYVQAKLVNGASIIEGSKTISWWMKLDQYNTTEMIMSIRGDSGADYFSVRKVTGGNISIGARGATSHGRTTDMSKWDAENTLENWTHILVTKEYRGWPDYGQILKIFINGVDVTGGLALVNGGSANEIKIGQIGNIGYMGSLLHGSVDELAVFDGHLDSPAEVTSIYNGGTPTDLTDKNPLVWYRNGDNGSWKSPQWLIPSNENKDKVSNYSLDFDGVDDFVDCGDITALDNVTSASWSMWANSNITSSYHNLISCYSTGFNQYLVRQYSTRLEVYISQSTGTLRLMNKSNFSFTAGTWFHIAIIYDESEASNSDKVKVYIDGVLQSNTVAGFALTSMNTSNGNSTEIGKVGGFTTKQYNGKIDEVAIFNSAVSIGDLWNDSGEPIDISGVSGITNYYKMGEEATFSGGVWTVPDAVGSNNGTSNGMTIEDRVGDSPNSENNALSYNMDLVDRTTDVPT